MPSPVRGPYTGIIQSAALPDTNSPSATLIQQDMQNLADNGGGVVVLGAGPGIILLETALTMLSQVSLHIPAGCVVRAAPGYTGDLISVSGVTGCRIFGDGAIIGNYDYTLTNHGIYILNSQQVIIHRLRLAGFGYSGVRMDGDGYNRIAEVTSQDNGKNGIFLSAGTKDNQITDCWVFGNSQLGAGTYDGVRIEGASLYNTITNLHAFDGADGTPTTFGLALQGYPVREVATGGTPDYTKIYALQAHGNVTSNAPSLLGAHSGSV